MQIIYFVIIGVIGYLMGSANTSLIVGKFYGVDVRKHGSGNAGMTNTLRTLGKVAALFVIFGDILKGVLACVIGYTLAGQTGLMVGGLAAVLGHNWPIYFGFKGGKGILTTFSVVLIMDWKLGLLLFGVFLIVVAISRYVSLGSIIAAALFPAAALLFGRDVTFIAFATVLAFFAVYRHRSNIQRIISGTESKLGAKKS